LALLAGPFSLSLLHDGKIESEFESEAPGVVKIAKSSQTGTLPDEAGIATAIVKRVSWTEIVSTVSEQAR